MSRPAHLFILDPLERLNLRLDSSLRLAYALAHAEQRVFICERQQLFWQSTEGQAAALARELSFGDKASDLRVSSSPRSIPLRQFASIQMRIEPPFDINYMAITWLLDSAREDTLIVNAPDALRRYNEKLAILQFPNHIRPALISSSSDQIFDFVANQCNGDAILKPLDQYSGHGIVRFILGDYSDTTAAMAELRQITDGGQAIRIVQAFDSEIYQGEVRAFAVGGEPVAWCLKVPAKGSYMANTGEGATLHAYEPSPPIIERVRTVSKALWEDGIAFVGYDLIGGFISEINVTSPRLLVPPGTDERSFYGSIANWVISEGVLKRVPKVPIT